MDNRQALLAFSCFAKIGPTKIARLEKHFFGASQAFFAKAQYLESVGIKPDLIHEFINWRKRFSLISVEQELKKEKVDFITWHDPEYPPLLKEISSAPYIIYYRGNRRILSGQGKNRLAIVGSRKHSAYAEKLLNELMLSLIDRQIEIISGLALGIDALAHQAALDNNGLTLAVLGSGLDNSSLYPNENRKLAQAIIDKNGLLLSEFPLKTPPLRQNFPQRNRIISGLAQATLIIEAKEKSGALITAFHALEQNREVLAIPGNVFSEFSAGPNKLIKMGAKTITTAEDILEIFKLDEDKKSKHNFGRKRNFLPEKELKSETEKIIYRILRRAHERAEKITTDEIIKITKLDTALINSTLSILELRGIAKSDGISYDVN